MAKDSHNSSLPPSSDRFVRLPKSLRQKSGKKAGGQQGHRGHHLQPVEVPDEVFIYPVQQCEYCHYDLRDQKASTPEQRQVIDLPAKRLWGLCCKKETDLLKWRKKSQRGSDMSEQNPFKWRHFQADIIRMSRPLVSAIRAQLS